MDPYALFLLAVPSYALALKLPAGKTERVIEASLQVPKVWIPLEKGAQCAFDLVRWFDWYNAKENRPEWIPAGFPEGSAR